MPKSAQSREGAFDPSCWPATGITSKGQGSFRIGHLGSSATAICSRRAPLRPRGGAGTWPRERLVRGLAAAAVEAGQS